MKLIDPADYVFLALEGRERPLHVGGLQLFTPPDGSGPEFARQLHATMLQTPAVSPRFGQRLKSVSLTPRRLMWSDDSDIDLDYHVRLSALPRPGRIRELLEMTSHWHSALLDRHRPLWEVHIIDGLADGRIAVYTKMHHAIGDGVTALKLMQSSLSENPAARGLPPFFAPRPRRRPHPAKPLWRHALDLSGQAAGLIPAAARIGARIVTERGMSLPMTAPRTIFNVPIGGARRFAAQSWEIARVRCVASALGCTLNDAVLAMCGGALRAYLIEQNALPDKSLVAFVPVSLHRNSGGESSNAVGAVLADLGTSTDDPIVRMASVTRSMRQGKELLSGLTPAQAMAVSAGLLTSFTTANLTGTTQMVPPSFNVCISNVPGPKNPLYWDGARLEGVYPVSLIMDGAALNITLCSNAGTLDFGIIGCRKAVPHLQRLLGHLEDSLVALEQAAR
ncbi:WS/DGAT/MGAT family O-acyltransferase [Nocardia sp. CA-151230]|uniref:WS/DGAT/MGAT family O-acyltransferase n=1 Tax=Nocardia sp. CA-151230 TaxID=3239982 RepID=UPI003D941552